MMTTHKSYFPNTLARRWFWVWLAVVMVLCVTTLFLLGAYQRLSRQHLTVPVVTQRMRAAVWLMNQPVSPDTRWLLKQISEPGLRFRVTQKPDARGTLLLAGDPASWTHVLQNTLAAHFNLAIDESRWLEVSYHVPNNWWVNTGFTLSVLLIITLLMAVCAFMIRQLAFPVSDWVQAAKRFSVDVQSPPLPLQGTAVQQQAIIAFNDMQQKIRQLIHDRTAMLAAISHDLRTPLTRCELRAEYIQDPIQRSKLIGDVRLMTDMINSILAFARTAYDEEAMNSLDLDALLQTICDDYLDTGHDVSYQGPGRLVVNGRLNALRRAITNLIDNAIKYGQLAKVSLSAQDDRVRIQIKDVGPGIPDTLRTQVFRPFFRGDQSRNLAVAGTGLGLATARDIICSHGGDIQLLNASVGLCVVVLLPVARDVT